jgi:hypothetical protein
LNVLWDLDAVQIQGTYQRTDTIPFGSSTATDSTQSQQANQDLVNSLRNSIDTVNASATVRLSDSTSAGLEGSFSAVKYHETTRNNGISYYGGAFIGSQLTNYISLRISGGYQIMDFDSGGTGTVQGSSRTETPYFELAITHHLNPYFWHTFSAGHDAGLGTTTNSVTSTNISETVTWKISRRLTLDILAYYQLGKESGVASPQFSGVPGQSPRLFGLTVSTGINLSQKLRMGVFYGFTQRTGAGNTNSNSGTSAVTGGNYYENRVGINFSYAF